MKHPTFNPSDIIGKKFNRLEVLNFKESKPHIYPRGNRKNYYYYFCKCDCGEGTIVERRNLKYGITKSCGCLHKERAAEAQLLPEGEANFNRLFMNYRIRAKQRNIKWGLTKQEFRKLTKENCFYCGQKPSQKYQFTGGASNGAYYYNGLDRLDNNGGYVKENVVPCCGVCNKMKLTLSFNEFISRIERILKNVREKWN